MVLDTTGGNGLRWDMGAYSSRGFLPVPPEVPVRHRNPDINWRMPLTGDLVLVNEPPYRYVLRAERVVAQWGISMETEERMALLQMLRQGWMTTKELAERWGVHRNTLGNWQWRYRFFGLDGLVEGRLPRRERLEQILAVAKEAVAQGGRRFSAAALGRALRAQGTGELPPATVAWLHAMLMTKPEERSFIVGDAPEEDGGTQETDAGAPPGATGDADATDHTATGGVQDAACVPDVDRDPTGEVTEQQAPTEDASLKAMALTPLAGTAPPEPLPEIVPAPTCRPVVHAGLALAMPLLQTLLDPLEGLLEEFWGERDWHYRPLTLVQAVLLYILGGWLNPEQVKGAPTKDFGPLLGFPRGPACITLRRRLPLMAERTPLVQQLQRALALQYLEVGWVEPGQWLVDGHFSPYFGKEAWAKGWWPQRRMAVPGYFQEWVHDRRGRPLWLHVGQGFDLFADQLLVVADGLLDLLTAAGRDDEPVILVFDRGGYSSEVFTALNARGVGWVTWKKGKTSLPSAVFTKTGELAGRTVCYTQSTHTLGGDLPIPSVVWHLQGDPDHQVALLSNLDVRYPAMFTPLQQIQMLKGRWAQENSFKGMTRTVDVDWTNGYVHEPCADTPVPNPAIRALHRRQLTLASKQRKAMDRLAEARTPRAQKRLRRHLGAVRGHFTRTNRKIAAVPDAVPYASLGRSATRQLHPGRGLLLPTLRAVAYHVRLQLRDLISAVFPDYREQNKVLRVILTTPGSYLQTPDADVVVLDPPHLPRYAKALADVVDALNGRQPHAPRHSGRPLRFRLAIPDDAFVHNPETAAQAT